MPIYLTTPMESDNLAEAKPEEALDVVCHDPTRPGLRGEWQGRSQGLRGTHYPEQLRFRLQKLCGKKTMKGILNVFSPEAREKRWEGRLGLGSHLHNLGSHLL